MLASLALLGLVTIQVTQEEHPDTTAPIVNEETAGEDAATAPQVKPSVQNKVVEHCEIALGKGECRAALATETASARVDFKKNRVVVNLLSEPGVPPRSLDFSDADTPDQRQVAAGLLVAAMSAAARSERDARERREEEQAAQLASEVARRESLEQIKRENAARSLKEDQQESVRFLFDLGATFSPPIDGAKIGLGGLLRTTWQATSFAGFFVELRFAQLVGESPRVRLGDAGFGASLTLTKPDSSVTAWLNAGPVFNLVEVSQVNELDESQVTLRGGGRLGFGVAPRLLPLSPWLAVDLAGFAPTVEVRAGDTFIERIPALMFAASVGARWDTSY